MTPMRLLVVDDHEVLRQGLRTMLDDTSDVSIIGEAADGAEAVDRIEELAPDAVLLDIRMPGVDGLEGLRRIRERWPELPVLIFTMYDDPEYVEAAMFAGASGYLLKSVDAAELRRAVRAACGGSIYLQAEVTAPIVSRFLRAGTTTVAPDLAPRERAVLQLLADGMSNRRIANAVGVSEATIKACLSGVFDKLGATDRAHAVAVAIRSRIID